MNIKSILNTAWVYTFFSKVIGSHRSRIFFSEKYIRPKKGDTLLDIGCGPGDILDYLADINYVGFDANKEYIQTAIQKRGKRGTFYCCEVGQEEKVLQSQKFDIVMANGVLHHLDDGEVLTLLQFAKSRLKPGGRFISFDGCFDSRQSWIARYLLKNDRGQYVRNEEEYLKLARSVFPNVKDTVRSDFLRIPYTHIIMEASLS